VLTGIEARVGVAFVRLRVRRIWVTTTARGGGYIKVFLVPPFRK